MIQWLMLCVVVESRVTSLLKSVNADSVITVFNMMLSSCLHGIVI